MTTTPADELLTPPAQRPVPLQAWLLLAMLALVWGSSFIMMKRSLDVFPSSQIALGRIAFAFLFFLPFLIVRRKQFPRHKGWPLFTIGLVGYMIPAFLFATGAAHLSSSLAGTLNSLSPLFTLLIGALFFGTIVRPRQVFGILLGFAGSVFLVFYSATGSFQINGYALLLVLATICYGVNINLIARHLGGLSPITSTAWLFGLTGPIALIGLLSTDFLPRAAQAGIGWPLLALLSLGILSSGLMSILFNRVIQLSSAVFASSVTYLMPVVALTWGLLDGEPLYVPQIIGMVVCLAGVYLVNKK